MKKVILINLWPTGGMKHYSDALANIINKNFDLTYINNYNSEIKKSINIKITNNLFNIKNYLALYRIVKIIKKVRPQTLHLNGSSCIPLILIYPYLKKYNSIFTLHDPKPHEGEKLIKRIYQKIFYYLASKYFKKIIIHSEKIKKDLPKFFDKNKVYIMNMPIFSQLSDKKIYKKEEKFTMLFFGRIMAYKGLNYLIKALNKLNKKDYRLIIAGQGKIKSEIEKNKNIKLINKFISDSEMKEIFSKTDILVLPYISASQSGVVYTSFAFNKPVIATDVGGISDAVKNGFNGLLIKPRSSEQIYSSIIKLMNKKYYNLLVNNIKKQKIILDKKIETEIERIYND